MVRPRLLHLTLLLVFLLAPLSADEASRAAKVEEFFRLSNLEKTYAQMMDIMRQQTGAQMIQQLTGKSLPPEYQQDFETFRTELFAILETEMGWERMKPEYVRIYMEAFSEEELDGIVAFYRSPAGQNMVAKTPSLMEKSSMLSQQRMALVAPKVQEHLKAWVRKMSEKASQPSTEPQSKPLP